MRIKQTRQHSVAGFGHIGVTVKDLDCSLAFYCGLLGFELRARWRRDEAYIQELVGYPGVVLDAAITVVPNSEVIVELLQYGGVLRNEIDPSSANPATAHLSLVVNDLPSLYTQLSREGVEFVAPPVRPTVGPNTGGWAAYMLDPDGFRVELVETSRRLFDVSDEERADYSG